MKFLSSLALLFLTLGCASPRGIVKGDDGKFSLQARYTGDKCPDTVYWIWGDKGFSRDSIMDCGKAPLVREYPYRTRLKQQIEIKFYEQGKLVGFDFIVLIPH